MKLSALALSYGFPRRPIEAPFHPCFAIEISGVLGEFKRSSQHSTEEKCDGQSKAAFRSMRARTIEVAGPASGSTAGTPPKVLGIDCGRPFNRGRCDRRRSVARGGWPVVPEGGRHDTGPLFAVFEASVGPLSSVCRARRDRHLAGSGPWRSGHCPQAWASAFDDLSRTASERCDPQRRTWNIGPPLRNGMLIV